MQKAFGPKHQKTFRDKYLAVAKGVAALILLFISFTASAQSYQPPGYAPKVNTYGNWYNRLHVDSALHLPRKYSLITNDNDTTPQIFVIDSILHFFPMNIFTRCEFRRNIV